MRMLRTKDMGTTAGSEFRVGDPGVEMTNVPLIANKRSKKCGTKYLKYATKGPALSARAASWRIVPVDGRCDRVMLYVASPKYRYLTVDSTCSKTSLSRGSGSVFAVLE